MKISIQNISKTYTNGVRAIDHLNLEISQGMFGLLGPNGAGKSSLMRTLATLQSPDSGEVWLNDLNILSNPLEYRRVLGYLPQEFGVYPKETAQDLLHYFGILKGITSKKERNAVVDYVLDITNLTEVRKKRVSTFSGGMRQRFGIAQLLLNDPKVIIVDEPTAGLDPEERSRFLNVLRRISNENIVLFSTHLVEDVRALCNDMAVVNKGRLLAQAPPKDAASSLSGSIWETTLEADRLANLEGVIPLSEYFSSTGEQINRVYAKAKPSDHFTGVTPKLEDFYFLTLKTA